MNQCIEKRSKCCGNQIVIKQLMWNIYKCCGNQVVIKQLMSPRLMCINSVTKNEQDVFLQSLITSMKVNTHRPRKEGAKGRVPHDFSFTYEVLVGDAKENRMCGCLKSFYGIKISCIRRLPSLLVLGKSPKGLRGKKLGTNAIRGNLLPQTAIC